MKLSKSLSRKTTSERICEIVRTLRLLSAILLCSAAHAQTEIDLTVTTPSGDDAQFWAQIPENYSALNPPAILIWWHQWGGSDHEMRDYSDFETEANDRGWIAASHFGPSDRHWNAKRAQEHCQAMLEWLSVNYPFSRDSIYMIGGSMGGAAGQIWHNNHCGSNDFLAAASAGASQILDCQLRQEQYLANGQVNVSMRDLFGGLPADRDSVAFEYHRASAIFFADTSQSMHFNSLHLPVWSTWGNSDLEWLAYGHPAERWDSLRDAQFADSTHIFPTDLDNHGVALMPVRDVCSWLSAFSANRYPDTLSINADESDDYYWTRVELVQNDTVFGRYGVIKDSASRSLEIILIHNIDSISIAFEFPWSRFDSLRCRCHNLDSSIRDTWAVLQHLPEPDRIVQSEGPLIHWDYGDAGLSVSFRDSAAFVIYFESSSVIPQSPILPSRLRLVSAYPNPFNSFINLNVESSKSATEEILFFDVLGRIAMRHSVSLKPGLQQINIPPENLSSGVYFVRMQSSEVPPLKITLLR